MNNRLEVTPCYFYLLPLLPVIYTAVKTLLKKSNLDKTILSNYRPISNLHFIGKIIEKVVFNQMNKFLSLNGYFSIWFLTASQHRDSAHKDNKRYSLTY